MLQVEKMASIGKLAAIVAHEINNPLAGILTYSKLMLKKLGGPERASRPAANGTVSTWRPSPTSPARCGEIVKNLLQFAVRPPGWAERPETGWSRNSLRLVAA